MYASVRALLHQIIDYAGLFPPAKLPLAEALRVYLHAKKTSPYAWMLGRFVCPVGRLAKLLALAKGHPDAAFLCVSVLGQQGSELGDFFLDLGADLGALEDFRRAWDAHSVVDTIEMPLPERGDVDVFTHYLGFAAGHLVQSNVRGFFEVARTDRWQDDVAKIAQGMGSLYDDWDQGLVGLKFRCGGVKREAFPSDMQIAFLIAQCVEAEIPCKATAGLHHPGRHWDADLNVWHHGFLNVFLAAILAWTHPLREAEIAGIIGDRTGEHFHFNDDSIAWKNWSCTIAQIADARANFATSFGCCSFEEPIHDLLAMGLLDPSEPEA